jgi:hypothetical protein
MWNAQLVTTNLYGFRCESRPEHWAATAYIHEGDSRIKLQINICLTYLSCKEDYELLLDAIRSLADDRRSAAGKRSSLLQYQCTGLIDQTSDLPLAVTRTVGKHRFADTAFVEERT